MHTIIVLGGAGAMGQIIVQDLADTAKDTKIIIGDFNIEGNERIAELVKRPNVEAEKIDIKNEEALIALLKKGQCVVNSTPYYFNVDVMKAALKAGCSYTDLGGLYHTTMKQLELNDEFKKANLTAVLGSGAAPGTTNLLAAAAAKDLDKVELIDIACGSVDFAEASDHPFFPPYMLDTLFDEYTKDAMVFENGVAEGRNPLAMQKNIEFGDPVGTQPAIYTLHSEVATLPMTYKDKGIKNVYFRLALPRELHEKLELFVKLGFGKPEPVETAEGKFHPRKILAHMISQIPYSKPKVNDVEILRVDVKGKKGSEDVHIVMFETATSDSNRQISAGDLNTGVPPSIVAQMIVDGRIKDNGVLAPEVAVDTDQYFAELEKRNCKIRKVVNEAVKG